MPSNNRKLNYRKLRLAGFNSYDANKFKDYGDQYVEKLVRLQEQFKLSMKEITDPACKGVQR
jgi:hypothetical protein